MKVLLIEDDAEIAEFIKRGIEQCGGTVQHEKLARQGILLASTNNFDVVIFDRMLPDMDGIDAIRVLRQSNVLTPIIVLTAMADTFDRVKGLDAGADDYMVKPFAFTELHARLKALCRRQPMQTETLEFQLGDLLVNRTTRNVIRAGQAIDLLPREYKILEYLLQHEGELVTKTMLLEQVWGFSFDPKTSLVQTHVSRLRSKIDKPFSTDLIKTVRGSGYIISNG